MNDVTWPSTENRVELILAPKRKARIAAILVTRKAVPEVPAPWPLAYVARKGPDVPDLRRRHSLRRFGKHRILPPDDIIAAQHVLEIFSRTLSDGGARKLLDRLSNRLTKILAEARKLATP